MYITFVFRVSVVNTLDKIKEVEELVFELLDELGHERS